MFGHVIFLIIIIIIIIIIQANLQLGSDIDSFDTNVIAACRDSIIASVTQSILALHIELFIPDDNRAFDISVVAPSINYLALV